MMFMSKPPWIFTKTHRFHSYQNHQLVQEFFHSDVSTCFMFFVDGIIKIGGEQWVLSSCLITVTRYFRHVFTRLPCFFTMLHHKPRKDRLRHYHFFGSVCCASLLGLLYYRILKRSQENELISNQCPAPWREDPWNTRNLKNGSKHGSYSRRGISINPFSSWFLFAL